MATARQVREHYDAPAELFELFLDRDFRAYSAGRWMPGDKLEQAQPRNLRAIIRSLEITPESAVLDVGCGWGALAKACVSDLGVKRYVGLTPSPAQIAYIKDRLNGKMEVHELSWQEFTPVRNTFDAVVALESIEHFASLGMHRSVRATEEYRRFFNFSASCTTSSAGLYVQTSVTRRLPRTKRELSDVRFILEDVFPGSALANVESLQRASNRIYALETMSWGAEDYLRTLRAWRARLRRGKVLVVRQFGHQTYDFFDQYLGTCIRLFDSGVVDLLRAQFAKER